MSWFFAIFSLFLIALCVFLFLKKRAKKQIEFKGIEDILILKQFYFRKIFEINRQMSLAFNKTNQIIALIENFNPKNPEFYDYKEISSSSIIEIEESKNTVKIIYAYVGKVNIAVISPVNKEVKSALYLFFKEAHARMIMDKYPKNSFDYISTSDWCNSYVWAYDTQKTAFVYYRTKEKQRIHKINLKKEHFIIDLKYAYFEAPILGEAQQLFIYEDNFLRNVFSSLFKEVKKTVTSVYKNLIFYDDFNNIAYISDGEHMLCSLILDEIKEIYFEENKIYFEKKQDNKTSQIILHKETIEEFEKFLIDYNIRKISKNFDTKSDKLINVTQDTKFIIDNTRKRLIYCANLNSLANFNYLIMSFDEVLRATAMKSGQTSYVRVQTKNLKNLDVTCKKFELAQMIEAQVNLIVN